MDITASNLLINVVLPDFRSIVIIGGGRDEIGGTPFTINRQRFETPQHRHSRLCIFKFARAHIVTAYSGLVLNSGETIDLINMYVLPIVR